MIARKIRRTIIGRIEYYKDRREYIRQTNNADIFQWKKEYENIQLTDRYESAGDVDAHYFIQDIEMARKIIDSNTKSHYDVGSRVDGFIAHLLANNIDVTMIDVRPFPISVQGLHFVQANATEMTTIKCNSIKSLSSLHAIEHFGLGRYGDPIDKDGWKKALREYKRILEEDGLLYLSVPIGPEDKVMFNAHRIFRPQTIISELKDLQLKSFQYIKNYQLYSCSGEEYNEKEEYLCGLFVFTK